tara:strand:- start:1306 stop:1830 length:525 start_codon:yes stop_codon:yes gene_type:complete
MAKNKKKIPIKRVNKFFDDVDFNLEIGMGREYLEGDLNFSVVLYRIDRDKTFTDDVYAEASVEEMRYHTPVELSVLLNIEASEPGTYNPNGSLRFEEYGKLSFHVYVEHLEELEVDITYGDYIAYNDRENNIKYFTVVDDGKIYADNEKTILGYKGFYRTIKCVPADPDEFQAI